MVDKNGRQKRSFSLVFLFKKTVEIYLVTLKSDSVLNKINWRSKSSRISFWRIFNFLNGSEADGKSLDNVDINKVTKQPEESDTVTLSKSTILKEPLKNLA